MSKKDVWDDIREAVYSRPLLAMANITTGQGMSFADISDEVYETTINTLWFDRFGERVTLEVGKFSVISQVRREFPRFPEMHQTLSRVQE